MMNNAHNRQPLPCSIRRHVARAALLLATTALTSPVFVGLASAQNLPTGGSVAAGSVAIAQPSATRLNITQSSPSAVVNWQSFSIGQGSAVNIAQPSASSAILNRVTGSTPSTIAGQLTANGQVYLVNPNGIAITRSGAVDVGGGFVASTLGISDSDFMSGHRTFTGNGASARVSNAGVVSVGRGGYAALIGGTVSNAGLISVPLGKVALGSGEQATLDFAGDGFLQVAMPTSASGKGALIRNSGSIIANGGSVIISAATAREAARSAINISGLVQAHSIGGHSGSISIGGGAGGAVRITGRLDATSRRHAGGNIAVTGQSIALAGASVNASGTTGGGTIDIGGGSQGSGPLPHADTVTIDAATTIRADAAQSGNGGHVVVWSDGATSVHGLITAMGGPGGGNGGSVETSGESVDFSGIVVNTSAINGNGGVWLVDPTNLTVDAATAATISANLATTDIVLQTNADGTTSGPGITSAGLGDIIVNSGIAWTSSHTLSLDAYNAIAVNAPITLTAGTLNLTAANGGVGVNSTITVNGAGSVVVSATSQPDISTTGLTFGNGASINYGATNQGGTFVLNGLSYTLVYTMAQLDAIDGTEAVGGTAVATYGPGLAGDYALATNLKATGTTYTQALIAASATTPFTGMLDGLGHTITGLTIAASGKSYVGLIGDSSGTVSNLGMAGGNISGQSEVGGLVGYNNGGALQNSYASNTVSGSGEFIGGLVGESEHGTVETSYATGKVSGGASSFDIGGLVGLNEFGMVETSYATGAVSGPNNVGGLVGLNFGATVQTSHATGAVSGGSNLGGLVGSNSILGSVQTSFATGAVSGSSDLGGLVGYNSFLVENSYATGAVSGSSELGGLVGYNESTVQSSYATGAVSGSTNSTDLGGLVGHNSAGTVQWSYATGAVSGGAGSSNLGGLVGFNDNDGNPGQAKVQNSFFDTLTTGQSQGIGLDNNNSGTGAIGLTTRQLQGLDPISGTQYFSTALLNVGNVGSSPWGGGAGGLYPYLTYFFPNGVQAISGFAQTSGGAAVSGGQVGIYSGGTLLTGGTASAGANGYFYEIVAAGTLASSNLKIGETLTLAGAGSVSGLSYTDAAAASDSVFALGTLTNGLNLQTTAETSYSALQTDLGATFGSTAFGSSGTTTMQTALASTPTSITATGSSFTIDQNVTAGAAFSLTTTAANATITLANNLNASGQTVTLISAAGISQTSGAITAATLAGSSNGTADFGAATNAIGTLGAFSTGVGAFTLLDSVSLALSKDINAGSGAVTIQTTGNLTIAAGARVSGASPVLAAGAAFVNNEGSDAVTATSGRWLVYSANPTGDTFDGLNSANTAVWNTAAGAAVAQTGDRYVFALQPTLTVTTTSLTKTYGVDATSQVAGEYTTAITGPTGFENGVTGAYLADSVATALTGTPIVTSMGSGAAANVAGSPYAITASAVASSGYKLVFSNQGTLTVTPQALTITANNASETYNGLAFSGGNGVAYSGFVNGQSASVLGGTLSYGGTAQGAVNAGSYTLTASGLTSSNYAISYVNGALTVTPAALTVAANNASKTYDGSGFSGGNGVTYSGFVNGQSASVLGGTLSYGGTAQGAMNAGSYTLTASGLTSSNYAISYVSGGLTINQRALTITAAAENKTYGDANPPLAYTLGGQGLVNGDTLSGGLATAANATSGVGTYAITQGNLAASANYAVTYAGANLTINQRPLVITADAQSRPVGDPNPALTYVIGGRGLVNGDTLTGGLATAATLQSGAGSYAITEGTLAANPNYAMTYVGANLTVTPSAGANNSATVKTANNNAVNPLVVAGVSYQPPKTTSINFVTTPSTPAPLIAFTQSAPNTRTASAPATGISPSNQPANPDDITGGIGSVLTPSADGLVYRPISQYDAAQYSGGKVVDHADQAGLATILTMIARAIAHDNVPTIDQLFDSAKSAADWHGVGWQNPLADKVTFSIGPQASEPSVATALALDSKTDLGALLGHGPVILEGSSDTAWLLAVARTKDGIVANDPLTGMRVLLGYDDATKTVGAIGKILDFAGNRWVALGDAGKSDDKSDKKSGDKSGVASVDEAKIAALQKFVAEKYLTVTLVK